MADRDNARVKSLQRRLRAAIDHLEGLRREASDMAAELRNRLHTVTVQRETLRRLAGERGTRRSHPGEQREERTDEPGGERDRR
jgi:hypothetical protein